MTRRSMATGLVALVALAAPTLVRAELIEDIVAWVNGEIISLSEFQEEERQQTAEAYRRLSGQDLDRWVTDSKPGILLDMIDRKILVHHAKALGYDLDKLGDSILKSFREQQHVASDAEFQKMIEQEGLTVEGIKQRLVEMYAPQEMIDFEVKNRVAVSDGEVERYYADHPEQFQTNGEVTIREIVLLADTDAEKDERRAEALALRERLVAGEDFATLAAEKSDAGTQAAGGLLGPIKRPDLSTQLAEVAFRIPEGEVSEVLETPYGFHMLRVESRTEDRTQSLDEVRDRLRDFLEEKAFRERLREFMTRMRDDSQWCVKPKYQYLLPIPAPTECETL